MRRALLRMDSIIAALVIATAIAWVGWSYWTGGIIEILLNSINKKGKRFLLPVPKSIANLQARFFELFPKPLLTVDQLKLLEYPNIITKKYMTINDLDIKFLSTLESEVLNYSSLYKSGGQFA